MRVFFLGKSAPTPFVKGRDGFTVIELLIVVAILGILSAAVVAVLSPAELLKQARDSTRVADLDTLNTALKLAEFNGVSLGSSSVVYLSLADTTSTCASYSLPTLPSGWAYRCATSANLNKTDGTGWIPVNFSAITETNVSSLPVDPSQNATSSLFYAYATGNRYALSAAFESAKYGDVAANDGGNDPSVYEAGGNPTLAPFMHGLVGYWNFDESSGTSLADSSGYGNTGTASGTTVVAGQVGNARGLNTAGGVTDLVDMGDPADGSLDMGTGSFAISAWFYNISGINSRGGITKASTDTTVLQSGTGYSLVINTSKVYFRVADNVNNKLYVSPTITQNAWHHVVAVWDSVAQTATVYIDGALSGSNSSSLGSGTMGTMSNALTFKVGCLSTTYCVGTSGWIFPGYIDEVRLYKRVLSANEVSTLYAAR